MKNLLENVIQMRKTYCNIILYILYIFYIYFIYILYILYIIYQIILVKERVLWNFVSLDYIQNIFVAKFSII